LLFVIMAFSFVIMALSAGQRHDHAREPTGNAMITKGPGWSTGGGGRAGAAQGGSPGRGLPAGHLIVGGCLRSCPPHGKRF
jgi:hypothetical protein